MSRSRGPGGRRSLTRVSVLVDLEFSPLAGGHVKCWERFAHAAVSLDDRLDLTVHFLGKKAEVREIARNVRIELHRPILGTRFFGLIRDAPGHTDLAPIHPGILQALRGSTVIHTTDAYFAQSRTARLVSRWTGAPLVTSLHTDVPAYARIYLERLIGVNGKNGSGARLLGGIPERVENSLSRRLHEHLRRCDWVFLSRLEDIDLLRGIIDVERASVLWRGIDMELFNPGKRDPGSLREAHGIPPERTLLLYVGRLDPIKNVGLLARAVRLLLDQGEKVHLLLAGNGEERKSIEALLGDRATFLGNLPAEELTRVYASADLFVFPSATEVSPNVVLEAKASGLPVVLSSHGGSALRVGQHGADGILVDGETAQEWALAIRSAIRNPARRESLSDAARRWVELECPSWEDVLVEDLLPVWERVELTRGRAARATRARPGRKEPRTGRS